MENITKDTEVQLKKQRRSAKYISVIIFLITFALVIVFGFYLDLKYNNVATMHEKMFLPTIMGAMLELFGIVAGTLVGRLVLIVGEFHVLEERYAGQKAKMIKACFSGIRFGPLIFLCLLALLCSSLIFRLEDRSHLDSRYLLYIVGGIGVWPLVMDLLQNNTKSGIEISTILEEKETKPAHIIAWNYYLNDVRLASIEFDRARQTPGSCLHKSPKLSSNKLLLLVSLRCKIKDDLELVDNKIEKISENLKANCCFSVYRLKINEHDEKYFAIRSVKEPLQTLRRMGVLADAKAVTKENIEGELNTFYFKLSKILMAPPDESSKGTLTLIPIKEEDPASLNNGGLVKYILDAVESSEAKPVSKTSYFQSMRNKSKKHIVTISSI